jgi:hypothetical protein
MIRNDKSQNPRWPPAAILDFGHFSITFERLVIQGSNLVRKLRSNIELTHMDKNWQKSKSKMAAGRHLGFRLYWHNFRTAWARKTKFGANIEVCHWNYQLWSEMTKVKNPRWPPAAIWDFGLFSITFNGSTYKPQISYRGWGLTWNSPQMIKIVKNLNSRGLPRPPSWISVILA